MLNVVIDKLGTRNSIRNFVYFCLLSGRLRLYPIVNVLFAPCHRVILIVAAHGEYHWWLCYFRTALAKLVNVLIFETLSHPIIIFVVVIFVVYGSTVVLMVRIVFADPFGRGCPATQKIIYDAQLFTMPYIWWFCRDVWHKANQTNYHQHQPKGIHHLAAFILHLHERSVSILLLKFRISLSNALSTLMLGFFFIFNHTCTCTGAR